MTTTKTLTMNASQQREAARIAAARHAAGEECPECGHAECESNGHAEWRCCACDHRWGYEYGERYGF